jgi:hypothetical protein
MAVQQRIVKFIPKRHEAKLGPLANAPASTRSASAALGSHSALVEKSLR